MTTTPQPRCESHGPNLMTPRQCPLHLDLCHCPSCSWQEAAGCGWEAEAGEARRVRAGRQARAGCVNAPPAPPVGDPRDAISDG